MKQNRGFFAKYYSLYLTLLMLFALGTVLSAFFDIKLMLIFACISLLAGVLVIIKIVNVKLASKSFSEALLADSKMNSQFLSSLKLPLLYTDYLGEILWLNESFEKSFGKDNLLGKNIYDELIGVENTQKGETRYEASYKGKNLLLYCANSENGNKIFYCFDNTALNTALKELKASRPAVMMIAYDNFNDVFRNYKESARNSFHSLIQKEIEQWLSEIPCITINKSSGYGLVVLENRYLEKLISEKFSILESVRKIKIDEIGGVTLSIGVGRGGKNLTDSEALCRQALEMAQSRGGDQVAIKDPSNKYTFFGGRSRATEKRPTIRARVVSSSICELLSACSKVVIMGHKYSDLDSLGAACGISALAGFMNKPTYIVFNPKKTLALSLYKQMISSGRDIVFTTGDDDLNGVIDDKTLLFIVDTHRANFTENSELFKKIKSVIVIDHHRKATDAIENSVIFYHETATSSTCEMVSELLRYVDGFTPSKSVSEALLSGIMLDSKNFCLHTGVRTFEAAAYLRDCGADPTAVKKLFSDSMPTYNRRSALVSSAKLYFDCAIAIDYEEDELTRIASAQAADELLNIENVNASFVMFKIGDEINISARSLCGVNVQLIMEELGGGGHQNMAACQLKCDGFTDAENALRQAIDNYKNNI